MQDYPVHSHLSMVDGRDIYKTGKWWKAVVRYETNNGSDHRETAVYVWHNDDDDGWKRKNKYVVKTPEAWVDDREAITTLLAGDNRDDSSGIDSPDELPVSDYYSVTHGTTVFKTEEWWKAVVRIDAKGDYETNEVIVYLWQRSDSDWKRRQKYAVKDLDDWEEEADLISEFVAGDGSLSRDGERPSLDSDSSADSVLDELKAELMMAKKRDHLSTHIES